MVVKLLRYTATDPPAEGIYHCVIEGIYHCVIEDDTLTPQTVYMWDCTTMEEVYLA